MKFCCNTKVLCNQICTLFFFTVYSDSDRQLYDSSEKGDTEQVAKLLTQDGADPDAYRDSRCQDRALHRACYNNYYKIVKLLLKHKADPNAMTVNQFTPLHVACLHGHLDCVRYLMDSDLCNVDTGTLTCIYSLNTCWS